MFGLIGEDLFHVGLVVMVAVFAAYLCFWAVSLIAGKKLRAALEREYGKKRH